MDVKVFDIKKIITRSGSKVDISKLFEVTDDGLYVPIILQNNSSVTIGRLLVPMDKIYELKNKINKNENIIV